MSVRQILARECSFNRTNFSHEVARFNSLWQSECDAPGQQPYRVEALKGRNRAADFAPSALNNIELNTQGDAQSSLFALSWASNIALLEL